MMRLLSQISLWALSGIAASRPAGKPVLSLNPGSPLPSPLMRDARRGGRGRRSADSEFSGLLSNSCHLRRHEMLAGYLQYANHERRGLGGSSSCVYPALAPRGPSLPNH